MKTSLRCKFGIHNYLQESYGLVNCRMSSTLPFHGERNMGGETFVDTCSRCGKRRGRVVLAGGDTLRVSASYIIQKLEHDK